MFTPINEKGDKKALLIANSYKDTKYPLISCEEDINRIEKILINHLDFDNKNITIKINSDIIRDLNKFIRTIKSGDLIYFYFTGHGRMAINSNLPKGEKVLSSLLTPSFRMVSSEKIDKILSTIPNNCKLLVFIDACNCGKFLRHYTGPSPAIFIGSSSLTIRSITYPTESHNKRCGIITLLLEYIINNEDFSTSLCYNDFKLLSENFMKNNKIYQPLTFYHI